MVLESELSGVCGEDLLQVLELVTVLVELLHPTGDRGKSNLRVVDVHEIVVKHFSACDLSLEAVEDSTGFIFQSWGEDMSEEVRLREVDSVLDQFLAVLLVQVSVKHSHIGHVSLLSVKRISEGGKSLLQDVHGWEISTSAPLSSRGVNEHEFNELIEFPKDLFSELRNQWVSLNLLRNKLGDFLVLLKQVVNDSLDVFGSPGTLSEVKLLLSAGYSGCAR